MLQTEILKSIILTRAKSIPGVLAIAAMWFTGSCLQAQPLTVKFDTQFLGILPSPNPPTEPFAAYTNNANQTLTASDIYVSFEASAAGGFSAMIGTNALTYNTNSQTWTYNGTPSSSVMSPSFTVAELNEKGFTISNVQGQNLYLEYGSDTIGGGTPPNPGTSSVRFTDIEFTYVEGSANNNADLTTINNIGSALRLKYASGSSSSSLGFTSYTSDMLPYVASQQVTANVSAASTPTGTPSFGSSGDYVAVVLGASSIPAGTEFYAHYPQVIATAISKNIDSPLLTNIPGGENPSNADLVLGAGFPGTITSINPNPTTYQVSMNFKPGFTKVNDTYKITFSGTITAVTPGFSGSASDKVTYGSDADPLKITVAGDSSSFYGYLSNGNVNNATVTLSGSGWTTFSTDFYNGGTNGQPGGAGAQAGPNANIAAGSTSNSSNDYGQIVQRALGDLQELFMIGAFGNESKGFGDFSNTKIGNIPSYNIWQDKSYAYHHTETTGFNTIGRYIWLNSNYVDAQGNSSVGAVYSNPYDDRFQDGVSLGLGSNGGTFTIQLREVRPATNTFNLVTHAANGSVSNTPTGSTFDSGTQVTLTATPASGYTFKQWHGTDIASGTTTNPLVITMDKNKTVTAEFEAVFNLNAFLDGVGGNSGWYYSQWFGWYLNSDNTSRWAFSRDLGLVYINGDSNSSFWLYSDTYDAASRDWWYTSKDLMTNGKTLYRQSNANWYSFIEVNNGIRWFYDFTTQQNTTVGQIEFNVNALLNGTSVSTDGWYSSSWFGLYNTSDPLSRWVYSDDLGSVYFSTDTSASLWFYSTTLNGQGDGWWYTTQSLYEGGQRALYRQADNNWYAFISVIDGDRWFYDFTTQQNLPIGRIR